MTFKDRKIILIHAALLTLVNTVSRFKKVLKI